MNSGYWEPHTSSIDFCETNYLHSSYISEIHNTWSSLVGLSSFGIIGLLLNNHTNEKRYIIAYSVLFLIGIGSASLHSTLHWFFQSADELPMMYLMSSILYLVMEHDSPLGHPNHPNLPKYLVLFSITNTAIYYGFQRYYLVFVFNFVVETLIVLSQLIPLLNDGSHIHSTKKAKNGKTSLMHFASPLLRLHTSNHFKIHQNMETSRAIQKMGKIVLVSIFTGFIPFWLYDMLQCHKFVHLADKFCYGLTPHVLWHFLAGFAAYTVILLLEVVRLEHLEIPFEVIFLCHFFPVVRRTYDEKNILILGGGFISGNNPCINENDTFTDHSSGPRKRTSTC